MGAAGDPARAAAEASAGAIVQALQGQGEPGASAEALAGLLPGATSCRLTLQCGQAAALVSGNLLSRSAAAGQTAVQSPPQYPLEHAVMVARKARLQRRPADDGSGAAGSLLLCLPLLAAGDEGSCSAAGATCFGALTVGLPGAAATGAALKSALLLAHALASQQRQQLAELAALVVDMVLPRSPLGSAGSAGSGSGAPFAGAGSADSEEEWDPSHWDSDTSSDEGEATCTEGEAGRALHSRGASWRRGSRGWGGGAPPLAAAQAAGASEEPPHSPLLTYTDPALERRFMAYHAKQMQGVDSWAYLLCVVFFGVEVFMPGTPFRLASKMGWRCTAGMLAMLPGLPLLHARGRPWFAAHREWLLAGTWTCVTFWQSCVVDNYMHIMDPQAFINPLYLQSFGWLTVVCLAFQMRLRWQAAAAVLAYVVNTQLLPSICGLHYDEHPVARCVLLGLLRVFLHGVLLPLACCYVFETHARRLFLRTQQLGRASSGGSERSAGASQ